MDVPWRQVHPDMPTVLLINRQSRAGERAWQRYRKALAQSLHLLAAAMPEGRDALRRAIVDAVEGGATRVIVGGGDGTLSLAADVLSGQPVALGVLPCGTGNTFAAGLGIRLDDDLPSVLACGEVQPIDVGEADQDGARHVFINSLTLGISERLVALLSPEAKRRLGWWAWPRHFRQALAETPVLRVHLDAPTFPGGPEEFLTRQLVVANGRQLAGPVRLSGEASLQDGRLDVFRLGGPSRWSMARAGWQLFTGRPLSGNTGRLRRVYHVTIKTDPPVAGNLDGEVWGSTPFRCTVRPAALLVIVPDRQRATGMGKAVMTRAGALGTGPGPRG